MKKIKNIIAVLGLVFGLGLLVAPMTVSAANVFDSACSGESADTALCQNKDQNATSYVSTIVNTLLYLLGAVAVIMIIYGGIRYTLSMGDAAKVQAAKNTILYSVVGLVVAILAYAIVNFVVKTMVK